MIIFITHDLVHLQDKNQKRLDLKNYVHVLKIKKKKRKIMKQSIKMSAY